MLDEFLDNHRFSLAPPVTPSRKAIGGAKLILWELVWEIKMSLFQMSACKQRMEFSRDVKVLFSMIFLTLTAGVL
jgi:hypothetical protein